MSSNPPRRGRSGRGSRGGPSDNNSPAGQGGSSNNNPPPGQGPSGRSTRSNTIDPNIDPSLQSAPQSGGLPQPHRSVSQFSPPPPFGSAPGGFRVQSSGSPVHHRQGSGTPGFGGPGFGGQGSSIPTHQRQVSGQGFSTQGFGTPGSGGQGSGGQGSGGQGSFGSLSQQLQSSSGGNPNFSPNLQRGQTGTQTPRNLQQPFPRDTSSGNRDPPSGASTSSDTAPSRKRLRELLANPQQRASAKKGKTSGAEPTMTPSRAEQVLEQSDDELYRKLDAEIRWDSFNYHSNKFADHIIRRVYGMEIDSQSDVYLAARVRVQDNIKSYKNKMLGEVRNHVTTVRNNRPDLIGKPEDEIENHFSTIFNESNWLKCWYYMDGYIEFRDCTDLGKWYMQSCYTTLCCKVWMDYDKPNDKNLRAELLTLYDEMCADPDFDTVLMREFSVINVRVRNQRQSAKALDGSTAKKFMKKRGPPPVPGAPARQPAVTESDDVFGGPSGSGPSGRGPSGSGGGLGGDATYDDGSYRYEDDDQGRFDDDEEDFPSQSTLYS